MLQVAAIGVSAQEKVSLNLKDVSAEQVFREIKRQTKYDFVYNEEQCRDLGKMSVNVKDEPVGKVLISCFWIEDFHGICLREESF